MKSAVVFPALYLGLSWATLDVSANPQFSHTEAGDIRIEESGAAYSIYSTDQSIGAFTSFGNQAGETINSIQASMDHSVIFKVVGTDPSVFFGALNANSHVFLVNPNGIVFKPGSSVDAPGLIAAAMDLQSADFASKEFLLEAPAQGGYVLNEGRLQASQGGYVALIGSAVENRGTISAPGGSVVLASGGAATVGLDVDGGISVKVTEALDALVCDLNGNPVRDGIRNSGQISSAGGRVILTAEAMDHVFDQVINHTGVIEAQTVEEKNGVIILSGGARGIVNVNGELNAVGSSNEKGGVIRATGEYVALMNRASMDASGAVGGGTVLIGGDYHGENPAIQNARGVAVGPGARIKADALESGNGGRVIVWSDETTNFHGQISARGGALDGDGGFAEVSSNQDLNYRGFSDLSSPTGKRGALLLDPLILTIAGGTGDGDVNASASTFNGGLVPGKIHFASTVATVYESELEGQSASADIILEACQTVNASGTFSGSDILLANNSNLTIKTQNNATDGAGGIDLTSGTQGANLLIRTQGTGNIILTGSSANQGFAAPILVGKLQVATGDITMNTSGSVEMGSVTMAGPSGSLSVQSTGSIRLRGDISTLGGSVQLTPASGSYVNIDPSAGSLLTINTSSAVGGGAVTINHGVVPGASGIDLAIDSRALSVSQNGGDVSLPGFSSLSGNFINDLTINASSTTAGLSGKISPNGVIELRDFNVDIATATVTGWLSMGSTGAIRTQRGAISVLSDYQIDLGFLDADSDKDGVRGNISLTATNTIYDANGNGPNLLADTITLTSTTGDVGSASNPLEAQYVTLNDSGVYGDTFLTDFFIEGDDPAEDAGLILDGNRITGGENFEEFLSDSSSVTDAGTEDQGSDEDQKEEEEGDAPAYVTPSQALPGALPIDSPATFPQETPVQPSTFAPCAG